MNNQEYFLKTEKEIKDWLNKNKNKTKNYTLIQNVKYGFLVDYFD